MEGAPDQVPCIGLAPTTKNASSGRQFGDAVPILRGFCDPLTLKHNTNHLGHVQMSLGETAMYASWKSWNLLAAFVLTTLYLLVFHITKRWETEATHVTFRNTRVALVTFGGLPLLAYLLGSIACVISDPVAVARMAFVYMAVLLPASLFFLFIATRRESLFNQYATSLDRLGLLRKRQLRVVNAEATHYIVEDGLKFARRVKSYLDRFSAVYGTLPVETVNNFLASVQDTSADQTLNADAVTGELFSSFELKTVLPVFGSSALIGMGWIMVLPPYPLPPLSESLSVLEKSYPGDDAWYLWAAEPVLLPAAFAFLGAYFYSLQMLIKRFTRRDLGPNAYNAVSMRIILATLGVWVVAQWFDLAGKIANSHGTVFVLSFAVGAFPLIIWQLVANMLKRLPGAVLALPNLEGTQPLSQIDGLSVWHEARLDEEDIENVPNLATADIVELMLNTKIAPNRVIDWVDQAMLLMVLPPQIPEQGAQKNWIGAVLRSNGIRTASALVAAARSLVGQPASILESFPPDARSQVISLAAAVQIYPNYPMVQNWLSTEPCFPPARAPKTALGEIAPPDAAPVLTLPSVGAAHGEATARLAGSVPVRPHA
jgi:hypothetical protein